MPMSRPVARQRLPADATAFHPGSLAALLRLLAGGDLTLIGLLPWSSNYTFLGQVSGEGQQAPVVYKPTRGERPLWDFPSGTLARREVAAYALSRALGWDLVPPTVWRSGPHGRGSVQLFVADVDQDGHFFTFHRDPAFQRVLQAVALFDVAANNADRKGGHCLRYGADHVLAIDHGICFSVEPKLRTVIWDFAGEPLPADLADDLGRLRADLSAAASPTAAQLGGLLSRGEIAAVLDRVAALLAAGRFPAPPEDRRPYPWPLV
jgi:uncharacterized repeat protein (TIGR03843 family)